VRLPRNVSPAAARRRERLLDTILGLLLALVVIVVTAGIGVVGFAALLAAAVLAPWYLADGLLGMRRRHRFPEGKPQTPKEHLKPHGE
jgi:NhaP-type Na+/H+ or K+/H+ antiporter